ncbi:MAG: FG-GAP-like repeat-containing protein [Gammaproteobacteria bacterium]|nr:FG-GAP-like repeat-containing protein [Gammaproteobacteria bacterium]
MGNKRSVARPTRSMCWTAAALVLAGTSAFGTHVADFNGDGKDDVLLWDRDAWHVHEMDGRKRLGGPTEALDLPRDTEWRVAGVGDLSGDGRDDVLFRHTSGTWFLYAMDGRDTIREQSGRTRLPRGPAWAFAGVGDFDGDGRDDVLLRHEDGRWVYFVAGTDGSAAERRRISLPSGLAWRFAGIGDLDGDGRDNVLLRHVDGRWFLHGLGSDAAAVGTMTLPGDTALRVVAVGDLNGDGNDDVLFRNPTGRWFYYPMDGRRVIVAEQGQAAITASPQWQLAGVGDLNGDGKDDVLLRHPEGRWYYYAMDGRRRLAGAGTGVAHLPNTGAIAVCQDDAGTPSYVGYVAGFAGSVRGLEAVLTGSGTLLVAQPDSAGCFAFHDVPAGRFAVKINADGHTSTPARVLKLPFDDVYDSKPYDVRQLPTDPFTYHWEEDQTTAGAEYSSHVVERRSVDFQGAALEVSDAAAAEHLKQNYNILLVEDGWSQEHAFRLLETMQDIPQRVQDLDNDITLPASAWRITDDFLDGDIVVTTAEDGTRTVTISSAAFVNAAPRMATVDGKRGVWFSKRLHHAAVRFVTSDGRDESAYELIFQERYGLTTRINDYAALTYPTGNESEANFQPFESNEIVLLINMLEEMPAGMHKLDGMRFLVRRLNGLLHPLYPPAPAVAWPQAEYVEFMESAFKARPEDYMHRLIIHEKAHFLWTHLFDDALKADWIDLGGWYEDPDAESGWSTTKTAEFVSAYAHLKDPNEDMAETISFFIINPDRLRARSMAKYEFVRDRIMQGDIYVALIREDLTFEVYNLFPDYVYPGKIRQVDILVAGAPGEDKHFTVDLELHALDGQVQGATAADTRIRSDIGTYFDLWLYPIDDYGTRLRSGEAGTRLRGEYTLSRYLKAGHWVPNQVTLFDAAGNERYQRTSDFGWRMYVDNPMEDYTPPEYVPGTMSASVAAWEEDKTVQVIHVDWRVAEDRGMKPEWGCYAVVNDARADTYSLQEYGHANADGDACNVDFLMPNYMPTSTYSVNRVKMEDVARNQKSVKFTGDEADEPPVSVDLETTNPDTEPPEIDVNRIEISAEPTNPSAPNGETEVTIRFRHRDNISGLTVSVLLLRDPQGGTHNHYIYPDDRDELYPSGDPTQWQEMERVVILPPGSIPGTWGLAEITAQDRAGNFQPFNFVEIVHFDVEGG